MRSSSKRGRLLPGIVISLKLLLLSFFLLPHGLALPVHAQDQSNTLDETKVFSVEFIQQFRGDVAKKKGLSRLSELLLGREELLLNRPLAISSDKEDAFWVLDQGLGNLLHHDQGSWQKLPLEKLGYAPFTSLVDICLLPDGKLLFTDSDLGKIFCWDPAKGKLHALNDSLDLQRPTGIIYHPVSEEIWLLETGRHAVSILDKEGHLLRRIGSRGTAPGEFNYPTHLCLGPDREVLIVDAMNFRVQVFDAEGKPLSMFGEHGDSSGYLARPKGIACDSYGHVYLADALFQVVQVFDLQGHYLYTFGKQGNGEGEFWMPAGISVNAKDHIFVSDSYNQRIQVFTLKDPVQ